MTARLTWLFVAFIAYTYAGYPLLLALLARLRPQRCFDGSDTPLRVTLLIAANDEEVVIARKLENSLALNYPSESLQILVAVDGCGDRTADIVRAYQKQGVDLSYDPLRLGKARAINRAMALVRGDIIVLSDANNFYEPGALKELVRPFSDERVGATTGAKVIQGQDGLLSESEGLYWRYESFVKTQETRLSSCTAATGEIMAVRRTLFDALPENVINDDFYLVMRVIQKGYDVVYVPTARSVERISLSADDEIARRARIVAGRYQAMSLRWNLLPQSRPLVIWQILSHKYFRPLVPLAMIGAFASNLAAVIKSGNRGSGSSPCGKQATLFLLFLQLAFYGAALSARFVKAPGTIGKLLYLPAFLANSNWAALVGLARFLRGIQPDRWRRVQRRDQGILPSFVDGEAA